ncbi:MAG: preprotein translocase subunit SecD [Methanosarcinaceae archaeon]|nr:preprotein translocase subunit SecD [Methanosarcinaceae archaeon]
MIEEEKERPFWMNWRIIVLVIALLASVIIIGPTWNSEDGFSTRINYGLDIEGGSWLQMELQGVMIQADADASRIVSALASEELGQEVTVTSSRFGESGSGTVIFTTDAAVNKTRMELALGSEVSVTGTTTKTVTVTTSMSTLIKTFLADRTSSEVTVFADEKNTTYEIRSMLTEDDLNQILSEVGGHVVAYETGVTDETIRTTIEVLNNKLGNGLGVKDLPIRAVGNQYILIDFAGIPLSEAQKYVENPGKFEIRIVTTGDESMHVLYGESIDEVNAIGQLPSGLWAVPFTLNDEGALALQAAAKATGATINPNAHELMMILDDEIVYSAPLSASAATQLQTGAIYSWQATCQSQEEAKELQIHLRSGALPVNMKIIGSGEVPASLGSQFLIGACITGLLTLIGVFLIIMHNYGKIGIAIPMSIASVCEVIIILAFSIIIGQELDLASLAGIIAVFGTGVDHLVIITDEAIREGKMPSSKLYFSRIGRAFAIIFGAAATTIVAMAPLLFMAFGSLKGFAVTTIAGVLIGVLIVRPTYGVILHEVLKKTGAVSNRMTDEEDPEAE